MGDRGVEDEKRWKDREIEKTGSYKNMPRTGKMEKRDRDHQYPTGELGLVHKNSSMYRVLLCGWPQKKAF